MEDLRSGFLEVVTVSDSSLYPIVPKFFTDSGKQPWLEAGVLSREQEADNSTHYSYAAILKR